MVVVYVCVDVLYTILQHLRLILLILVTNNPSIYLPQKNQFY